MDTIVGKGRKSAILTLCERSRNYLIMERLPHGMDHGKVADAVIRLLYPYRKNVLAITTDNGFEFRSVQLKLNRRPREKLNFSTPKDEFFRLLL